MSETQRTTLVVVPREPNRQMQRAGEDAQFWPRSLGGEATACVGRDRAVAAWDAMVKGAPELADMLAAAYEQGCHDTHANYEPCADPEFGEAASDYAADVICKMSRHSPDAFPPETPQRPEWAERIANPPPVL